MTGVWEAKRLNAHDERGSGMPSARILALIPLLLLFSYGGGLHGGAMDDRIGRSVHDQLTPAGAIARDVDSYLESYPLVGEAGDVYLGRKLSAITFGARAAVVGKDRIDDGSSLRKTDVSRGSWRTSRRVTPARRPATCTRTQS